MRTERSEIMNWSSNVWFNVYTGFLMHNENIKSVSHVYVSLILILAVMKIQIKIVMMISTVPLSQSKN